MALALVACGPAGEPPEPAEPPEVGAPAPDFTLRDAHGEAWTLSEHVGAVVVLDVAAAWCDDCRALALDLEARQGTAGLAAVAVLIEEEPGEPADPTTAAAWTTGLGLTHPVLWDAAGTFVDRYHPPRPLPWSVIVDRDGVVAWTGDRRVADADAALTAALE